MTDELYLLWRLRVILQLLAPFTGLDDFCDIAGGLDVAAAQLWHARAVRR